MNRDTFGKSLDANPVMKKLMLRVTAWLVTRSVHLTVKDQ